MNSMDKDKSGGKLVSESERFEGSLSVVDIALTIEAGSREVRLDTVTLSFEEFEEGVALLDLSLELMEADVFALAAEILPDEVDECDSDSGTRDSEAALGEGVVVDETEESGDGGAASTAWELGSTGWTDKLGGELDGSVAANAEETCVVGVEVVSATRREEGDGEDESVEGGETGELKSTAGGTGSGGVGGADGVELDGG